MSDGYVGLVLTTGPRFTSMLQCIFIAIHTAAYILTCSGDYTTLRVNAEQVLVADIIGSHGVGQLVLVWVTGLHGSDESTKGGILHHLRSVV